MLQENIFWAHIYVRVLKLEQQLESLTNSILKPQSPGRVGGEEPWVGGGGKGKKGHKKQVKGPQECDKWRIKISVQTDAKINIKIVRALVTNDKDSKDGHHCVYEGYSRAKADVLFSQSNFCC